MQDSSLPVISVITPTFDREKYIEDCVLSVVCSRHTTKFRIEHLIVDDGSTDNTCDTIDKCWIGYDPVAITRKIIKVPHSGKPSIARNIGIKAATGKYIFCLDSDDVILRNTLMSMFDYLENDAAVDIVVGDFVRTNESLSYTIGWDYTGMTYNSNEDLLCALFSGECVLPPSAMFRSTALNAINGYNEDLTFAEDNDLLIRLALDCYTMHSLPITAVLRRYHDSNMTNDCNIVASHEHNNKQFSMYSNSLEKILSIDQMAHIRNMLDLDPIEYGNKIAQITSKR